MGVSKIQEHQVRYGIVWTQNSGIPHIRTPKCYCGFVLLLSQQACGPAFAFGVALARAVFPLGSCQVVALELTLSGSVHEKILLPLSQHVGNCGTQCKDAKLCPAVIVLVSQDSPLIQSV